MRGAGGGMSAGEGWWRWGVEDCGGGGERMS